MKYELSPKVRQTLDRLLALDSVKKAMAFAEQDAEQTLENQIELCKIEAPTFHEQQKAARYAEMYQELSLKDVHIDDHGNVVGVRPGVGGGKKVLMEGHMDTVFPIGTNPQPRREGTRVYAPGIVDDTRGMVVPLSVVRSLNAAGIQTKGDLICVGTVEEEGVGSFGGMLHWLDHNAVDASISVDGGGFEGVVYEATGHMTCEATFHGIGGHAHGAFGQVANPLNAAARAVAKIADFQVPSDPKTSFCVSNFHAGNDAGIHAIVPEATIKFNFRSDSQQVLDELYQRILTALQEACDEETARWGKDTITFTHKRYCNVPAGTQDIHSPMVEAAYAAIQATGCDPYFLQGGSTNCNMAIGKNIPAVCLGIGGADSGAHTLNEFFETTDAHKGVQEAMLLALLLAGVEGETESILD